MPDEVGAMIVTRTIITSKRRGVDMEEEVDVEAAVEEDTSAEGINIVNVLIVRHLWFN